MERIEIPLSRIKIILILLGSIIFVVLGYCMAFKDIFYQTHSWCSAPAVSRPVGILAVFFFGLSALFMLYKLFVKNAGLIIDNEGFTDCSGGVALGFVRWDDVTGFRVKKIQSTRFLLIYLSQPQKYLSKYSKLKQKQMGLTHKMYGTPFSITSTSLTGNFDELHSLLEKYLEHYKSQKG